MYSGGVFPFDTPIKASIMPAVSSAGSIRKGCTVTLGICVYRDFSAGKLDLDTRTVTES